jgi:hypothetical protein
MHNQQPDPIPWQRSAPVVGADAPAPNRPATQTHPAAIPQLCPAQIRATAQEHAGTPAIFITADKLTQLALSHTMHTAHPNAGGQRSRCTDERPPARDVAYLLQAVFLRPIDCILLS